MDQEFLKIVGLVALYLERHPDDGMTRLKEFMDDESRLWLIEDVMAFSGWKRTYISQLCTSGKLPYIHGNPYKYVPQDVRTAIIALQEGGIYGRRRSKKLTRR